MINDLKNSSSIASQALKKMCAKEEVYNATGLCIGHHTYHIESNSSQLWLLFTRQSVEWTLECCDSANLQCSSTARSHLVFEILSTFPSLAIMLALHSVRHHFQRPVISWRCRHGTRSFQKKECWYVCVFLFPCIPLNPMETKRYGIDKNEYHIRNIQVVLSSVCWPLKFVEIK